MRWPFARRRLISISLRPASRPAAWSGFGLPRTTTLVLHRRHAVERSAPARRAAALASRRGRLRMPVNARWTPLSVASRPALRQRGRVAQRLDQLVGGLVALAALADAAVDDLLQLVAARAASGSRAVRIRARASPFTSIPISWPTW